MFVPLPKRYKIPLLIALTFAIGVIVFSRNINFTRALLAVSGSVLGILILDLEYILQAYLIDPYNEYSVKIKEYLSQHRYLGFIRYIDENEYKFGEMSIRSVAFQSLLAVFGFYFIMTNVNPFAQCLTISLFANLLYFQVMEFAATKTLDRWFWILEANMTDSAYKAYMIVMFVVLVLQIYYL